MHEGWGWHGQAAREEAERKIDGDLTLRGGATVRFEIERAGEGEKATGMPDRLSGAG